MFWSCSGFSFVYLVEDASEHRLLAVKKIRCPFGSQAVADAMRELDMYRMFRHEHIIQVLDTALVTESDGSKTIYMFLPYYKRGNLQDCINANNVNKTHFSEPLLLRLILQVCYALRVLHTYRLPEIPVTHPEEFNTITGQPYLTASPVTDNLHSPQMSYSTTFYEPTEQSSDATGALVPYAHRDVKPGNILIADDGENAVLMDFGSVTRARTSIKTRQDGLLQQDIAAEHSTMPYRAPELYDVKTGSELNEKVDIWSLGCTLYAAAYGQNPFEATMNDMGGSMALTILNGQYIFPSHDPYSEGFRDLIRCMLIVDPTQRSDVHEVIAIIERLLSTL
ncbi:kinase-like domain-containing protein [Radiomyces spectabilis]|uniref:kinase-like domain-containing protein n=1 Tax=Radiomyces spectabilis TaxID=64574 RepID=UPI00221EE99D|nr:kinase-like domain-containing protein [Radiomyces spectabilis]KAI8365244.1 kinase-like domain-containing protein [Radiomyces spectabilis]